jgi:hypothetical protein
MNTAVIRLSSLKEADRWLELQIRDMQKKLLSRPENNRGPFKITNSQLKSTPSQKQERR